MRVSTSRAMNRRSGRAPYTGSKPCWAMKRRASSVTSSVIRRSAEPGPQVVEHQVDDALDLGLGQRLEQHDVVEPVEELGPEVAAQLGHHERRARRA